MIRSAKPVRWPRWFVASISTLLAALGAWPTPGLLGNFEPGEPSGPEPLRRKAPRITRGVRATIAGLASVVLGGFAVVTALYGMEQDPLGTALYNRMQINVGDAGPLILSGTVVVIGLGCAALGLRRGQRWPAITGICVNSGGLVLAVLVKLAVEHGFGA
jgi:hypothetical protein